MTRKRNPVSKGSAKTRKNSPTKPSVGSSSCSPKKHTTIASLFQRQIQQQSEDSSNTSPCKDGDNENLETDDVTFLKEERTSEYFSAGTSLSKSEQGFGLDPATCDESKAAGEGVSLTETVKSDGGDSSAKSGRQKSLSRRLSLRKLEQRQHSGPRNSSKQGSCGKAGQFISDSEAAHTVKRGTGDTASSGGSSVSLDGQNVVPDCTGDSAGSDQKPVDAGDTVTESTYKPPSTESRHAELVGDKNVDNQGDNNDKTQNTNSIKNRLSLKRKRKSRDDNPTPSDPPKKQSSQTSNSVFSIFRAPASQLKASSSKDSLSSPSESTNVSGSSSHTVQRLSSEVDEGDETSAGSVEGNEDKEEREDKENGGEGEETVYRLPYYLENFRTIVNSVFEDDYNLNLFNQEDLAYRAAFDNLTEPSQKLYVRLFSRKLAWLPTSKIKYPAIADELDPCLQELLGAGLLSSGEELDDLSVVLNAMATPDLRMLAKSYHLSPSGQQKGQIIAALLAKSQPNTSVASFFGQKTGGVKAAMLKKAKAVLGAVYRLRKEARAVFVRAMMLSSLVNTSADDDTANGGQGQLFQMLLVNMGKIVYPSYTVNRKTHIFRCRSDLISFEEALQLENELTSCVSSGDWKGAYTAFLAVKEFYQHFSADSSVADFHSQLPDFLRSYTAGSVAVRLLSQGIEILQRRKDYQAAVVLIRQLLDQPLYCSSLRGYWWDRLALNLDVHLKQQEQALQAVQEGLADPMVRTGHRLSLVMRAETICSRPKSPFTKRIKEFTQEQPLLDLPKVFVDGRVLPHTLPGSRYQFITEGSYSDGSGEDVTLCNVEQVVLDHYQSRGFPQGVHAEGSVVSSLFCLYLWDQLFMDVEDAFHSAYQTTPLDFHSDAFYQRRHEAFDEKLDIITNCSTETLADMVSVTWEKQNGVTCAGINWERFTSLQEIQGLVRCIGGRVLSAVLGRYARQPRHTRGGFPDLTLWNTSTGQLKICEVKGPGDRLSHKQMLWLDFLLRLGVDAEVCHVRPLGVKKLKPSSKD